MKLSAYTIALLEDIERRIDPAIEDDYLSQPHLNAMLVILGSAREQNKKIPELKNAKAYALEYPGKGGVLHAKL